MYAFFTPEVTAACSANLTKPSVTYQDRNCITNWLGPENFPKICLHDSSSRKPFYTNLEMRKTLNLHTCWNPTWHVKFHNSRICQVSDGRVILICMNFYWKIYTLPVQCQEEGSDHGASYTRATTHQTVSISNAYSLLGPVWEYCFPNIQACAICS